MTTTDFTALSPMIAVGATVLASLLLCAFARRHALVVSVTVAGLALALALLPAASAAARRVTILFVVDPYTVAYWALVLGIALVTALLGADYFGRRLAGRREEFYVVLLLATLGGLALAAADHFVSFFLGLETLSISLYAMIAYVRREEGALDAGIKYLVLAGASSAFLLFGMALLYLVAGTLSIPPMARALALAHPVMVLTGAVLVVVGIGFKLAVVPFHMWTADVYEGAPAPVTGFLATASKAAVFAVVLRLFAALPAAIVREITPVFVVVAAASMLGGNLLALMQKYVKRILAYSSIAHMGYLLVAFVAGADRGAAAATFYLYAYAATTLAAFGALGALSHAGGEPETLDDIRGLFWRRPALASVLGTALFSLAGIPLTAGFLGKFYVMRAGVDGGLWLLLVFLVVNSAVGLFYYLRIIVAMFTPADSAIPAPTAGWTTTAALIVLVALLVWMGVYPSPLSEWIARGAAAAL